MSDFILVFAYECSNFPPSLMKILLTWIMVLSTLAGINFRVVAADGSCVVNFDKVADCCKCTLDAPLQDNRDQEGQKCPVGHNHLHGCCSHVMPLAAMDKSVYRFSVPSSSLLVARHKSEVAPEEPFLGSEKPPLI